MLHVARFGSPSEPVVLFAGERVRAFVSDDSRLFGTLDALGATLGEVRVMSPDDRCALVCTLGEPADTITPLLEICERVALDLLDGAPTGERHHAIVQRPLMLRAEEDVALLPEAYFQLRFPRGREPALTDLARALCLVGRLDRAAAILRAEVQRRPDDAPLHFHLGEVLRGLGRSEEAIPCFQRSAALAPQQMDPRSSLAIALVECNRHREAKQVYGELVELGGGTFEDYMNLATACCNTGELDDGMAAIDAALAAQPSSAHAHAIGALIAAQRGDRATAHRHCTDAEAALPRTEAPLDDVVRGLLREARTRLAT